MGINCYVSSEIIKKRLVYGMDDCRCHLCCCATAPAKVGKDTIETHLYKSQNQHRGNSESGDLIRGNNYGGKQTAAVHPLSSSIPR